SVEAAGRLGGPFELHGHARVRPEQPLLFLRTFWKSPFTCRDRLHRNDDGHSRDLYRARAEASAHQPEHWQQRANPIDDRRHPQLTLLRRRAERRLEHWMLGSYRIGILSELRIDARVRRYGTRAVRH